MKKYFLLVLFVLSSICISQNLFAESKCLTILFFGDFHGQFYSNKGDDVPGGAGRLYSAITEERDESAKKGCDTLLFFDGDAFTGSYLSNKLFGRAEIDFLNLIDTDVMVIGNHEWDFGVSEFEKRVGEAKFPVISENIFYGNGNKQFAKGYEIIKLSDGTRVGILGLTVGPKKLPYISPDNGEFVRSADPIDVARKVIKKLNKKSDIQIALVHIGVEDDKNLAESELGFEAIIGGHSHVEADKWCRMIKEIPVCETPAYARYLGKMEFLIDGKRATYKGVELIALGKDVREDSSVLALINKYESALGVKQNDVLGNALEVISHQRGHESKLGDLITDAIRERTGADAVMLNSGSIRKSIAEGPITVEELYDIMPFANHMFTLDMKGEDIIGALKKSLQEGGAAFLQVSGLEFKIDDGKPTDIKVLGEVLDKNRHYKITTSDYLYYGNDGYDPIFNSSKVLDKTKETMMDIVASYIKSKKQIASPRGARISVTTIHD